MKKVKIRHKLAKKGHKLIKKCHKLVQKKTQTYEENVTKNSQTSEKKVINW